MAPDNFQNLGLVFKDDEGKDKAPANAGADSSNTAQPKS
jgi:cytochrome c oxidase assembly protein subunit 19